MIEKVLRGKYYDTLLDFGSGPGLMLDEWGKYAKEVILFDTEYEGEPYIPFVNITICASVMEFVDLMETFNKLANSTNEIIVASPMKTAISKLYFNLIRDNIPRNSEQDILAEMTRHFRLLDYTSWNSLYFCAYGVKR